ncbi:hypothetical protein CK203_004760 [Vitis vinifera]|uniref:Uncharacterized protein n=1 Tax=Vitis vinifera TaxID=29760 RepID=A0A438KFZ7_VITVI|nr:hypothetical protein CK203_004760 [Vitis vinifera]
MSWILSENILHALSFFGCHEGTDVREGEMHPPGWPLLLVLSDSIGERLTGCHIGQFALVVQCPKDVVEDPLNPDKIRPGFSRPETVSHVATNACTRSPNCLGQQDTPHRSLLSRDKMRASRCGCSVRVGSTGGKMIVPSMGRGPLLSPGRMELMRSRIDGPQQFLPFSPRVMSCLDELLDQILEAPACFCRVTVFLVETHLLLRSLVDGRVGAAYPGDSVPPASIGWPWLAGGLAFLSASPLDGRPATKTCWVAARTSSSSIEYLLAHASLEDLLGQHPYCKPLLEGADILLVSSGAQVLSHESFGQVLKLPTELGGFPSLLLPLGANERSASWGVTRGHDAGERFAPWGGQGQGVVPRLWPLVALIFQALGPSLARIEFDNWIFYHVVFLLKILEALNLLLGLLNADVEEALMLKPDA